MNRASFFLFSAFQKKNKTWEFWQGSSVKFEKERWWNYTYTYVYMVSCIIYKNAKRFSYSFMKCHEGKCPDIYDCILIKSKDSLKSLSVILGFLSWKKICRLLGKGITLCVYIYLCVCVCVCVCMCVCVWERERGG